MQQPHRRGDHRLVVVREDGGGEAEREHERDGQRRAHEQQRDAAAPRPPASLALALVPLAVLVKVVLVVVLVVGAAPPATPPHLVLPWLVGAPGLQVLLGLLLLEKLAHVPREPFSLLVVGEAPVRLQLVEFVLGHVREQLVPLAHKFLGRRVPLRKSLSLRLVAVEQVIAHVEQQLPLLLGRPLLELLLERRHVVVVAHLDDVLPQLLQRVLPLVRQRLRLVAVVRRAVAALRAVQILHHLHQDAPLLLHVLSGELGVEVGELLPALLLGESLGDGAAHLLQHLLNLVGREGLVALARVVRVRQLFNLLVVLLFI
mmetsp:Transcript_53689/g.117101  ORF Transcript_53689/g.117101 Transcript_53689/m.117101 type:complete len:316 (-) Transcript_53689:543-1490(-)